MIQNTSIEIKNDSRAHETGNAFIEIISNDVSGRVGGLVSSKANWLAYHIYYSKLLFLIDMKMLQSKIQ